MNISAEIITSESIRILTGNDVISWNLYKISFTSAIVADAVTVLVKKNCLYIFLSGPSRRREEVQNRIFWPHSSLFYDYS